MHEQSIGLALRTARQQRFMSQPGWPTTTVLLSRPSADASTPLVPLSRRRRYQAGAHGTRVDPRRTSRWTGMPLLTGSCSMSFGSAGLLAPLMGEEQP